MSFEARIVELGLELPEAPPAAGTYAPVVIVDGMAYVSGQGPIDGNGRWLQGRVGDEITEEEGNAAARVVGLTMLATIKAHLGSLDKVDRVVKEITDGLAKGNHEIFPTFNGKALKSLYKVAPKTARKSAKILLSKNWGDVVRNIF